MKMLSNFLNRVTMYNLVTNSLAFVVLVALILSLTGALDFRAVGIAASAAVFMASCVVANIIFARLYNTVPRAESSIITALILCCIFSPLDTAPQALVYAVIGCIAMASKYVLAYRGRHIFNPAAIAAVIIGLVGVVHASWWIATPVMAPFVVLAGALILAKLRRFMMVLIFMAVSLVIIMAVNWEGAGGAAALAVQVLTSWPILFFALFMLTEPITTPTNKRQQLAYAGIIAVLFAAAPNFGGLYVTPEVALAAGNVLSYSWSIRRRLKLKLLSARDVGEHIREYTFAKPENFSFVAGQYLDTVLPSSKLDRRGYRRTFTIASAPTESTLKIATKHARPSSTFKTALETMKPGAYLEATNVGGTFTLPNDPAAKLVLIAGGVGITPFCSMAQSMIDTRKPRDIELFYAAPSAGQLIYREIFDRAEAFGFKGHYVVNDSSAPSDWSGERGRITPELIQKYVTDLELRTFYVSGSDRFVDGVMKDLRSLGIPRSRIKTDYFSGY